MDLTNKCQYWSFYEPPQCEHWNDSLKHCGYSEDSYVPTYAPSCNNIGTAVGCDKFKLSSQTTTYFPRCVLPDTTRHVCNKGTGVKWVISEINGYNNGECDGLGTNTTCSGYASHHMGFGNLTASDDESVVETCTVIGEFDLKLPMNYVVYNIRALLSKCYWWSGTPTKFIINTDTTLVELVGSWNCVNTNDVSIYNDFSEEYNAPCNGCKPECPYYTGICWEYCIDDFTKSGDPILAEQIHEIRYYHKENQWTTEKMERYFIDSANIFTWDGSITDTDDVSTLKGDLSYTINDSNVVEEYQIPSKKTYMAEFDSFDVSTEHLVLSEGTQVTGVLVNFPTLIKELNSLALDPIIKNKFSEFNVFESHLLVESNMLVYGKVFYSAPTYAINISDRELSSILPVELYRYDSLLEAELALGPAAFDSFYKRYEATLAALFKTTPNKFVANELDDEENSSFLMSVPVYYSDNLSNPDNKNTILVFQKLSTDRWAYSKITFKKGFVGGVLLQSEFNILGDGKSTRVPLDYTKSFMAGVNNNGTISFSFSPISSSDFIPQSRYLYNDLSIGVNRGHKLYEITCEEYVLKDGENNGIKEFSFLGSDGYMLVSLEHPYINNIFGPWEFEEINVTFFGIETPVTCEMELVHHGTDGLLAAHQLIVKAKDINDFRAHCSASVTIKKVKYWEKRSYNQEPEIFDGWESELVIVEGVDLNYIEGSTEYSEGDGIYTLTNFQFSMVPSVIINNREGRPFTQYRTKPIGWVKQPMCPDVEIKYSWSANFMHYANSPMCRCCGVWKERSIGIGGSSSQPPCGDHDISMFSKTGPMWWPYTNCESFDTYNVVSNLDNYSWDVIGLFKDENTDGDKLHGDHDMRMLGPPNNEGYHDRGCNFLLPCSCNWRTFNKKKNGDNYFTGWGRIRGLVPDYELYDWDVLPKFGNVNRAQLNSYKTIDKWAYSISSDGGQNFSSGTMLMPATMQFNKVDFTDTSVPMWNFGASDVGPNVVNPLGMYIALSVDGIAMNESIDSNNRFDFDDVFHCRISVDGLSYPVTAGKYSQRRKAGVIYPWYEFKRYPVGGGSSQIQWAWQEMWKPVEHNLDSDSHSGNLSQFIETYLNNNVLSLVKGPFILDGEDIAGHFLFLDVNYPDYEYDYTNKEFQTVIDEGEHTLTLTVPEKDEYTGEYLGLLSVKLDDGPVRGITWEGNWAKEEDVEDFDDGNEVYNIELYENCIGGPDNPPEEVDNIIKDWLTTVTLFGTGYDNEEYQSSEDDDRMLKYYEVRESIELTKQIYFQRGLQITPNASILSGSSLPLNLVPIDQINPLNIEFIKVCGAIDFHTVNIGFDSIKRTLGGISISFKFGIIELSDDQIQQQGEDQITPNEYYHIPQFTIYATDGGETSEAVELFSTDNMELCLLSQGEMEVVEREYVWDNTLDYIGSGKDSIFIKFRITPNSEELSKFTLNDLELYNNSINIVNVVNAVPYEDILVNATEHINTWERKYLVSHGNSGYSPPQGVDITKPVFRARANEKSTYYQHDGPDGVTNIPGSNGTIKMASKAFSRHLYEIHEDEESLDAEAGVRFLEEKQKVLYSEALSGNVEEELLVSIMPPGLEVIFNIRQLNYTHSVNLMLKNSLLTDLADINHFDPLSGEGNEYRPGPPTKSDCGGNSYCGPSPDDVFDYKFTNKDSQDSKFTGEGGQSAFDLFYGGTENLMYRSYLAETVLKTFYKKYGASSQTKIWTSPETTDMLFAYLQPVTQGDLTGGTSQSDGFIYDGPDYNANYFPLVRDWHNAYFNTADRSGTAFQ